MKLTKNKALLTICVFILMIQFVSVALAAKPVKPQPRTSSIKYGYAILEDVYGNLITSDLNGQYVDIEKVTTNDTSYWEGTVKRGDKISVLSYDDPPYELIWLRAFIGKPELLEGSTGYRSPRRVNFNFDFYDNATTRPGEGIAVYDILSKITPSGPDRNLAGTVHFVVAIGSCDFFGEGIQNRAMFLIDPGCEAIWPGTDVICQRSVDAFYTSDVNSSYWTAIQGAEATNRDYDAHDQIGYHMLINQLNVASFDTNNDGKPDKWEITPKLEPTTLIVYKDIGRKNKPNYVAVPLATYESMPFKLTLSLNPFTTNPAPPKEKTSATLWGEIKK
jgi:hypothetical protein